MSYNIAANFDYSNLKISASVNLTGGSDMSNYTLAVYDSKGFLVCTPASFTYTGHRSVQQGTAPTISINAVDNNVVSVDLNFGIYCQGNGFARTNSSLLVDSEISHGLGVLPGVALATGLHSPTKTNALTGYQLMATQGESCFRGKITAVTDKTRITWSTLSGSTLANTTAAQSNNFLGDMLYIYSGNGSGTYTTITSTGNGYTLDVDSSMSGYTGSSFVVYPIRTITGYIPWSDTDVRGIYSFGTAIATGMFNQFVNVGTGLEAPLEEDAYPAHVNSYLYSLYGGLVASILQVTYSGQDWGYKPQAGDLIRYRSSATPTVLDQVSFIYYVPSTASDTVSVYVYPGIANISSTPGYTDGQIIPANRFTVLNYPGFNEDLTAVLRKNEQTVHVQTIRSPSASVELSANDHDSVFGSVASSAHFHMGPIKLSNGSYVTSPHLKLTASLYNNDPTQSSADKTWSMKGTANPNAAVNYTGQYYRHGVFVGNYDTSFTSAQILTMVYSLSVGSASVNNVVSIPVHPAL